MKKLISKLFGFDMSEADAPQTSKQTARERLEVALTYDRAASIGYNLEQLRDEIIQVVTKHLEINQEDISIQLDRTMDQDKLIASIPLRINTRSYGPTSPATMKATSAPSVRHRRR